MEKRKKKISIISKKLSIDKIEGLNTGATDSGYGIQDQNKIKSSSIVDDKFTQVSKNLQDDLNEIRTQIRHIINNDGTWKWLPEYSLSEIAVLINESNAILISCDSNVDINNVVYIKNDNIIYKAKADSSTTMPGIGIIIAKPTSTTAYILLSGEIKNWSSGMTSGNLYYISKDTAGVLTITPPNSSGEFVQLILKAINSTDIIVQPDSDYIEIG